jgi:hypothetical protein
VRTLTLLAAKLRLQASKELLFVLDCLENGATDSRMLQLQLIQVLYQGVQSRVIDEAHPVGREERQTDRQTDRKSMSMRERERER